MQSLLGKRGPWLIVVVLLAAYAAAAISVAIKKGTSFDEGEQLAVGYGQYLRKDFRMEGGNGDLIKRWATLPFLVSHPYFLPKTDPVWLGGEAYSVGYEFLFRRGNQADSLLLEARAMAVIIGIATGLLIYLISRGLFGPAGGLVSLALFVFSPAMLAFGTIVSTEMSLCVTLLASTWCIWRLLHRVSWGLLFASLGCSCLLILAKPTGLIIVPIAALLVMWRFLTGRPLQWRLGRPRRVDSRSVQLAIFLGLFILHVVAGWGSIWAQNDFRYSARPDAGDRRLAIAKLAHPDPIEPPIVKFIGWSRRAHFLPEGYLNGIEWLLGQNDVRESFIDGRWKFGGRWSFFPRVIWLKGSPALLGLIALGIWAWRSARLRGGTSAPEFYEAVPWIAFVAVYFGAAMIQDLNIGQRHILPIYPPLYVMAGGLATFPFKRRIWAACAVGLMFFWLILDSAATYPDYLAYFNPLLGGTAEGYKYLVDSSTDWGMDLPTLKTWLDQHDPNKRETVYLAYFGTDSPGYQQLKCTLLPSYVSWVRRRSPYALEPGLYAISATLLQSVYLDPFGPWNNDSERKYKKSLTNLEVFNATSGDPEARKALLGRYPADFWMHEYDVYDRLRFARLCAWLRHYGRPVGNAGYSILIFRLDADALHHALEGPPPEIDDTLLYRSGEVIGLRERPS